MKWKQFYKSCGRYVNKYTITLALFSVVLFFWGQQSLLEQWRNSRMISRLESEKRDYKASIRDAEHALRCVDQTDSLERLARETYYMHTPDEDVFLVEE